jgi:hypothetical protein
MTLFDKGTVATKHDKLFRARQLPHSLAAVMSGTDDLLTVGLNATLRTGP